MNYKHLLKVITAAYYSDHFEQTVNSLLEENAEDKEQLYKLIDACCGVETKHSSDGNYAMELKKAIQNYSPNNKVVTKFRECGMECADLNGKTCCQKSCAFDAILVNEEKHTTFIDDIKCIGCGFCIEACPNHNFIDRIEFLPMANLLKKNRFSS